MVSNNVYFKQNILVEPLFNRWYAWANLIPPVSAAMYIANSHLKIMESFVSSPQVHVSALKNPAMLGGPFINYDASKVSEIKSLVERTKKEQAPILEFARAVKTLDDLLQTKANGFSLESLYPQVPEILKGYVELVYDLHDHPSMRFMDGLLYKSKYYNPALQSISLSQSESDDRSFVFSTPRLDSEERLFLDLPFNHQGLDELFRMKFVPQPYEHIKDVLNIRNGRDKLFSSFFTEEAPKPQSGYDGEKVRIRYFGHACILIETRDVSILCDPVISYKDHQGVDRYIHADLPETIDYVLITHNHQDHIMFETLLQLRHKIKHIVVPKSSSADRVDPSLKLILQTIGFKNVLELDELESVEVAGGQITGLPFLGEHADLNVRTKLAYYIELQGKSILCAADSNNLESKLYEHIHELFGEIDVLFLGMECDGAPMSWLYGPLFTKSIIRKDDQSRRLNGSTYENGISIVNVLKPKEAYVYAMGQEPWLKFLTSIQYTEESRPIVESNKLVDDCVSRGLKAERLYVRKEIFL
jgi:L-ascorbate metabolism protein UlaG (beta-lactamase superfamily)